VVKHATAFSVFGLRWRVGRQRRRWRREEEERWEAGVGGGGGEERRKRDLEEAEEQRAACVRKRESWCIFYLVKEFVLLSLRCR